MSKFRKNVAKVLRASLHPSGYRIHATILLYGNNSDARNHYYSKAKHARCYRNKKVGEKIFGKIIFTWSASRTHARNIRNKSAYSVGDAFAAVDDISQFISSERAARDEKVPQATSIKADKDTKWVL